jgi:ubiquinone/menaquinone biosynthesis C-methylase UbiE
MDVKPTEPSPLNEPTQLPSTTGEAESWQQANRGWWQSHPMRYDWKSRIPHAEFSPEFFGEIDRRFFAEARRFMPWRKTPFDALIPFDHLGAARVLEIGVGNGSHAQLLATHAREFVGIDLTSYAVEATTRRLQGAGLDGAKVLQMDAEALQFEDASFDFIWTWGVIHHSANTEQVLREMARVLKPGGRAVVMVYHRSVWLYYVMIGLIHGVVLGDLFRTRSLSQTAQRHTDGALARYYRADEWRALAGRYFDIRDVRVYGAKPELVLLPGGRLKRVLMAAIPDSVSRFFLNPLGWGSFLVSVLEGKAD